MDRSPTMPASVLAAVLVGAVLVAVVIRLANDEAGETVTLAPRALEGLEPGVTQPEAPPRQSPRPVVREDQRALDRRVPAVPQADVGGRRALRPESVAKAERRAARARGSEGLSRQEVRAMLERWLGAGAAATGLPAHSDAEYERMTDAVLQVRAAQRALHRVELSQASAEVVARERAALTDALADFERASGIAPSRLGDVLAPESGVSRDEGPESSDSDEDVRELLADYPPPR